MSYKTLIAAAWLFLISQLACAATVNTSSSSTVVNCATATGFSTSANAFTCPTSGSVTFTVSAPTSPVTGSYTMQGLSNGQSKLTVGTSGTVLVTISGTIVVGSGTGTATGTGIEYQIYYGTGTAPTNSTGTGSNCGTTTCAAIGSIQENMNGSAQTAGNIFKVFSNTAVITGLSVGTAYWFDLAAQSVSVTHGLGFSNVNVAAVEIR